MNPDMKAKLDQALQSKRNADAARLSAEDIRRQKVQGSINKFIEQLTTVVRPAFEEINTYLNENGVKGSIQEISAITDPINQIKCPSLRLRVGLEAYIGVELDAMAAYARFPYSTMVNGSGRTSSYNGVPLTELTSEQVQSYAAELITEVLKAK